MPHFFAPKTWKMNMAPVLTDIHYVCDIFETAAQTITEA